MTSHAAVVARGMGKPCIVGAEGISVDLRQRSLSSDLGVSGLLNAPEMRDAIGRLEKVILEAGIPLGTYALSPEQTRALLDKGYRLLVHGVDVLMIAGLG